MAHRVETQQLLQLLKEQVLAQLTLVDEDTGLAAISARDLASLGNLVLNISKREEEIEQKLKSQGITNDVVAFPALPSVETK